MGSSSDKDYIIEYTCKKLDEQEEEFERQLERETQNNIQRIRLQSEREMRNLEERRRRMEERARRLDEQLWQQQQLSGNGNLQRLQNLNFDFQY